MYRQSLNILSGTTLGQRVYLWGPALFAAYNMGAVRADSVFFITGQAGIR